jgi:hypothetical protein
MGRLTVLVLLLCAAGCESTDFYDADTRSWFATPSASSQAPSSGPTGVPANARGWSGGVQQPAPPAP